MLESRDMPDLPGITPEDATPGRWSGNRTRDQRWAESELAASPYRVEVRGRPQSLNWPDVCAHCGAAATERLRIRRAFYRRGRRSYGGPFGYRVVSADVAFCPPCLDLHRAAVSRVSWFQRYKWFLLNPAHIATIGFIVLLAITLPSARDMSLTEHSANVAWGLVSVFVLGIIWTIGVTWWMSRPDRFEPRTEITSSCLISNDVSQFFEGRRHLYGFKNQAFSEAFQRANEARLWTGRDQAQMWKRSLIATILLIVLFGGARLLLWYYEGR